MDWDQLNKQLDRLEQSAKKEQFSYEDRKLIRKLIAAYKYMQYGPADGTLEELYRILESDPVVHFRDPAAGEPTEPTEAVRDERED
jgi:hypothetical protein